MDVREVERYVLRVALTRGWITEQALQRAATFRSKQTARGRQTTLLKVLRPFVSPANFKNLERTWQTGLQFVQGQEGATATGIESGLAEERPEQPRPTSTDPRDQAIDLLNEGDGAIDL